MPVFHVARAPEGAVFIGRPSRWGNPYRLKREEDRAAVLEQYRRYLWAEIDSGRLPLEDLAALDGADLACYCAPRACHGDVLEQAAAWAARKLRGESLDPAAHSRYGGVDHGTASAKG